MTRFTLLSMMLTTVILAATCIIASSEASRFTSANSDAGVMRIDPVPSSAEDEEMANQPGQQPRQGEDEAGGDRYFCGPDSWKRCIGNSRPCWCYERAGRFCDTVEKAAVREYNEILVTRQYDRASLIFAENFLLEVPSYEIRLEGRDTNIAYLALGDPDVSDSYQILNSTIVMMTQEDNLVIAHVKEYFKALHSGNVFGVFLSWAFTFNKDRQMTYQRILPDSQTMSFNFVSAVDLNTTSVCTRIQTHCTGPLQQYPSVEACVTFLNSIPATNPPQIAHGNTVTCRSFHEILARSAPDVHCQHVGMHNLGPIATPCAV